MSKNVPDGWTVKKLIDCSVGGISNGVFRDPKTVGSGYKLINVLEMYKPFGIDVNSTERLPLKINEFIRNKVNHGDVFFTRSSLKLEGIAYCNINLSHDDDITYEGHLMRVVPDKRVVEPEFLARYCLSDSARTFFMSSAKHSTMTTISQSDIAPLEVLLPPLREQQKIAAILTAVDEVIESTTAQINKLKDLKTGMMQELLTKGIGHTEFKDSPVGRIPSDWDVISIGQLGDAITGNTPKTNEPENYGGVIPFISPADIGDHMYVKESKSTLTVLGLSKTRQLPQDAILVVCIGSTIGKTGIATRVCATNQQINAIVCKDNDFRFVYYLMTYISKVIKGMAGTQAVPIINKTDFCSLLVQRPSIKEQMMISCAISAVDQKISVLEMKRNSIIATKKALMQDLLTGAVRVTGDC